MKKSSKKKPQPGPFVRAWARYVNEMRSALGLSQEEFGNKVGVQQGTISEWESGKGLTAHSLERAVEALNVDMDRVLRRMADFAKEERERRATGAAAPPAPSDAAP